MGAAGGEPAGAPADRTPLVAADGAFTTGRDGPGTANPALTAPDVSSDPIQRQATDVLAGSSRRGRFGRLLPFLGPAFIASIAYMDPGNFATNIQGGAQFGYLLIWVVVASNLMAMLVQSLSAKLGIATGLSLPAT